MNTNWWVLLGQLIVLGGAVFTVIWGARNQRRQPVVDSATAEHTDVDSDRLRLVISQTNEQANAMRDMRLAQFHGFLLQDFEWHFVIIANEKILIGLVRDLVRMVEQLGGDVSQIIIPPPSPPPPKVPEPPPIIA